MNPEKAVRLLASDRVRVHSVAHGSNPDGSRAELRAVGATVKGDSGPTYDIRFEPLPVGWVCSCPAKGLCSHITAVALVTGTGQ